MPDSAPATVPLPGPVLIAAFGGWNDAGTAATAAVLHMREVWGGELIHSVDPEDYYDFQVARPTLGRAGVSGHALDWPGTTVTRSTLPSSGQDIFLIEGTEPSMRWRSYCAELIAVARERGVQTIIVLGAMLADVPHTRPLPIAVHSYDEDLTNRLELDRSDYEGPVGITSVLQDIADAIGLDALAVWAAVPHYVAQTPAPSATIGLLNKLEDLVGEPIELGQLVDDARAWRRGVDEMLEDDQPVAEYVQQLESLKDTTDSPEASGDAIAAEFEKFLRKRGGGTGAKGSTDEG
ncbi:PAC2 family protein [Rarobacter incanus]|uniref:PAC2 family protein n=1 Tax=Rarobacter incanus TaxID=153494 RepID=A0A542SMA3_9MICO|nr:PAC2 family protein [Rarobacter incanus]TQK75761.1 PAC2 family protein [Rarobacter incanus]